MTPYFVVLVFILCCAIIDRNNHSSGIKTIVFVVLTLFAGLRYNVGIDYVHYINIYESKTGYEMLREPGRAIMVNFVKAIGGASQSYIFVMALITEYFSYQILIKNEKKDFWLLTILFYCVSLFYIASFNASRQYMAIAFMIWSMKYIEKDKWKFFLCSIIAGFGFHFSALMFLPLYFFIKYPHKKWHLLLGIVVVLMANKLVFRFLEMTPYAKYESWVYNDVRENSVQPAQILLLLISFGLMLFDRFFKYFKNNTVLVNLNALCFYTLLLVVIQDNSSFIMLFQRFNNYFVFSYLLIIPSILNSMKKTNKYISKVCIVFVSIGYLILTVVVKGEHHMIVPYDINLHLFTFL